jgi:hypothetical protein
MRDNPYLILTWMSHIAGPRLLRTDQTPSPSIHSGGGSWEFQQYQFPATGLCPSSFPFLCSTCLSVKWGRSCKCVLGLCLVDCSIRVNHTERAQEVVSVHSDHRGVMELWPALKRKRWEQEFKTTIFANWKKKWNQTGYFKSWRHVCAHGVGAGTCVTIVFLSGDQSPVCETRFQVYAALWHFCALNHRQRKLFCIIQ